MTTYAIKNWSSTFEDNRSRVISDLRWVRFPVRQDGDSFRVLMETTGGVVAYGVFCALVQVAARCPKRGVLQDDKGPITPERAARRLGMPVRIVRAAWDLLSSEAIGWLVSDTATKPHSEPHLNGIQARPGDVEVTPKCVPMLQHNTHATTQHNTTQHPEPGSSPSPVACVRANPADLPEPAAGETTRDVLVALGINEPTLTTLSTASGLTAAEVRKVYAATVDDHRQGKVRRLIPSFIDTLKRNHGITVNGKRNGRAIGADAARFVAAIEMKRKQLGTA